MWCSLHWRINCRSADATSGALRPAIASCQRMSGVFDANISLKATGRLTNRCSLAVSLGSTTTLCISAVKQTTSSGLLVFNTSLSVPYFVFGIDYAFYTLIRVAIRIFDGIFIAEANFTLVLRRSFYDKFRCFICFLKSFCKFPLLTSLDWDITCIVHSYVYSGSLLDCMSLCAGEWLLHHTHSMTDDDPCDPP